MKIKEFEALYADMDLVASPDSFFGSQKKEFPYYMAGGFYNRMEKPYVYVYQITNGEMTRTGLVAATSIEDVIEGHIKKHENTLAEKEQKMLRLVLQRDAMIKPVLLAHDDNNELLQLYNQIISEQDPFMDIYFELEKTRHKLYKVDNKKRLDKIKQFFSSMDSVYIADGHHRVSTGLILYRNKKKTNKNYGDLLSIYFGFDQLSIYDYNRVVSILKEISPTILMAKLSKYFEIELLDEPQKPKAKFQICMIIENDTYLLQWKQKYLDMFSDQDVILDAELLDKFVFNNIMGIEDVRHDQRLSYISGVEGIEGISQMLLKDDYAVGFLLFPVTFDELKKVANAGKTLPPKSTWFEPRVKNAVISKEF